MDNSASGIGGIADMSLGRLAAFPALNARRQALSIGLGIIDDGDLNDASIDISAQ